MLPIIEVNRLSKQYDTRRSVSRETFREFVVRKLRFDSKRSTKPSEDRAQELWALDDVSFEVAQGDVIGILGGNGAGKSTLLKIISKITDPTLGSATLRGRLGSLLEVGAGFHPELTGRENIYLHGAILGMSTAETDACFDEIVAFSGIEKFLDLPLKRYSSGMYLRLAFSVAAHLNTEILVADEVLAVGDAAFERKCLQKMREVNRQGRTILFVSHNMAIVLDLCRRGMVLDSGKLIFDGTAQQAVQLHVGLMFNRQQSQSHRIELSGARDRRSPQGKFLKMLELYTNEEQPVWGGLPVGANLRVRVHFDLPHPSSVFDVGLGFYNAFGQRVFTAHTLFEPDRSPIKVVGRMIAVCEIPSLTLIPGDYVLRVWLDIGNTEADLIDSAARITILESDFFGTGKLPKDGAVVLAQHWSLDSKAG